jgi:hypothetical protein
MTNAVYASRIAPQTIGLRAYGSSLCGVSVFPDSANRRFVVF